MKKKTTLFQLIAAIILMTLITGCNNEKKQEECSQLVVKTLSDTVEKRLLYLPLHEWDMNNHYDPYYEKVVIKLDYPVSGPQRVVDSIKYYLNKCLYDYFFTIVSNDSIPSFEEIFTKNSDNIIEHYKSYYYLVRDRSYNYHNSGFAGDMEITLKNQTDEFVIYAIYSDEYFLKQDGSHLDSYIEKYLRWYYAYNPEIEEEHFSKYFKNFKRLKDLTFIDFDKVYCTITEFVDDSIVVRWYGDYDKYTVDIKYSEKDIIPYMLKDFQNSLADNYLKEAKTQLEAGNCDAAESAYKNYKQISKKRLTEIEEAINDCQLNAILEELYKLGDEQDLIDYIDL